ncbi:MAG: adenylate kinase [Nitrososphaerota archaeon]|nr:adenylate kinase [Nitrososphaerota archaeon]
MKIIVAAVPGAGKSTTLKFVKKRLHDVKVVNVGDLILEVAKRKFKIKDRDELRKKLTINQERSVQELVYRKIAKMKGKVLIDTHISIKTPAGFFPSLPDKLVGMLKPDAIILLEFNPRDIIKRRVEDKSRKRDVESVKEIEDHQKFNRIFASAAAAVASCPLEVINLMFKEKKKFEHAYKAAEEIIKIIRRLE